MKKAGSAAVPAQWAEPQFETPVAVDVFEFDGWRLCPSRFELRAPDGALTPISPMEVRVLAALLRQPGHVHPRARLQELGGDPDGRLRPSALDCRMSRLRRRLRRACSDVSGYIRAVRQEGYVFTGPVRRSATT